MTSFPSSLHTNVDPCLLEYNMNLVKAIDPTLSPQRLRSCTKTSSSLNSSYFSSRKQWEEGGNISLNIAPFFPLLPREKTISNLGAPSFSTAS